MVYPFLLKNKKSSAFNKAKETKDKGRRIQKKKLCHLRKLSCSYVTQMSFLEKLAENMRLEKPLTIKK